MGSVPSELWDLPRQRHRDVAPHKIIDVLGKHSRHQLRGAVGPAGPQILMRDSMDRRTRFAPQDLDATIARSNVISDDPLAYTSGMAIGGSQGRCVPLPPASGTAARYMATCNVGYPAPIP